MNPSIQKRLSELGVIAPSILLPTEDIDLFKWATIACDQHTSEPDYWEEVEELVGDAASTLHVVFPEVYLGSEDADSRVRRIKQTMHDYLDSGVLAEREPGMILTVRGTPHVTERKGLMLAVDLEQYDYDPGAASLIRASEQTIVDRIPPRVKIRRGAPVEIPHVLVLIDDPTDRLFGGLQRAELNQLYQTQLMLGGGNVAGYELGESDHRHVADALESLLEASTAEKPFLFAVGDGNHSLATAKAVWEEVKSSAEPGSPARYALVEVVNLYDPGLRFEPIHRLVTFRNDAGSMLDWVHELSQEIGSMRETSSQAVVRSALDAETNVVGYVSAQENGIIHLADESALAVAILQSALDERADVEVDYIHGWDTSVQLGSRPGSAAFLLPQFDPHQLFPTVENRGVLPRKAFSLGDAEEKRYYLEARRILES